MSVDPAPSCSEADRVVEVRELEQLLRDSSASLFTRYRAMFSLRNRGGEEAALALASGFKEEGNALFKHEVAYVLGQVQHPAAVPALVAILSDLKEHPMVRHEAAEALGAIGGLEAGRVLEEFRQDKSPAVKESCEVALDTMDYWSVRA
ncbi:unnamed protein product [Discosporangium mesarthrocarpum]